MGAREIFTNYCQTRGIFFEFLDLHAQCSYLQITPPSNTRYSCYHNCRGKPRRRRCTTLSLSVCFWQRFMAPVQSQASFGCTACTACSQRCSGDIARPPVGGGGQEGGGVLLGQTELIPAGVATVARCDSVPAWNSCRLAPAVSGSNSAVHHRGGYIQLHGVAQISPGPAETSPGPAETSPAQVPPRRHQVPPRRHQVPQDVTRSR